jgi:hypothetical protein
MSGFDVLGRKLKCNIINDQTGKIMVGGMQKDYDLEEDNAN